MLQAGLCPGALSHPWTLLMPRPFLGKSSKTPAWEFGEWKTVSRVRSLSLCISFHLG